MDDELDCIQKKTVKNKFAQDANEKQNASKITNLPKPAENKKAGIFEIEPVQHGDEFMAVKPWLGAIKAPTTFNAPPGLNTPPNEKLKLEYVYGYRTKDCRNNLVLLDDGRLIYHAAAVGIVLDPKDNTQQLLLEKHTDDITAFTYHKASGLVVTGEIGPKPKIYIWDSNCQEKLPKPIQGGVIKGIVSLDINPTGDKLVATCVDDNHMVAVYDTATGAMVALEKGGPDSIYDAKWIDGASFSTVGPKHFKNWKLNGKTLSGTKGQFSKGASDVLACCCLNGKHLLAGSSKGELQVWTGGSCSGVHPVHTMCIDAIHVTQTYVLTGAKDKKINILANQGKQYSKITTIDFQTIAPQNLHGSIRALYVNSEENTIAVGTFSSEIWTLKANDKKSLEAGKFTSVTNHMRGHYSPNFKWTNEVWGLAVFSDGDRFLTCSDDATLRMWSSSKRKELKALNLNIDAQGAPLKPDATTQDYQQAAKCRSIGISPDDKYAIVGTMDGTIRFINIETWKQQSIAKQRKRWIQEIRFSPDGSKVAVGSHDCFIDIYSVPQFKFLYACKGHSSYITHIDWSVDGSFLHTNCGAYELLFWDGNSGKQLPGGASSLKDEDWHTWSCVLGWPVQGIFQPEWDGTDINMVDRSHKEFNGCRLLAMGTDFSTVGLFRYPALKKNTPYSKFGGHSSHVTNVRFSSTDELLFSTGGEDQCVFQWKVE